MRTTRASRRGGSGAGFPRTPRHRRRELPALEWAEDVTGRCARVTAVGSHSLLVENHCGIDSFSQERIALNTGAGPLCVHGRGLALRDVRPDALIVHGEIHRVELPCRGGDAPDEG